MIQLLPEYHRGDCNSVILTAGAKFFHEDEDSSLGQKRYDGQSGSGTRCILSSLDFALEREDHCYY